MIRREIHLPGKAQHWLLISQIEHARISALLAERCLDQFGQSAPECDLIAERAQLLAAISHHDDGWAAWDTAPQLDPQHHRPPSFREMQLEQVLPIWTASIEAAAGEGALAGLTVARHFLALLDSSDKETEASLAKVWREEITARHAAWLADWQAANLALHTPELVAEALLWLQLSDVASLWLCSACPGQGEQVQELPESYHFAEASSLASLFCYSGEPGLASVEPWRLDVAELTVEASGHIVPIREYQNTVELLAEQQSHSVRWVLTGTRSGPSPNSPHPRAAIE
jgi:hypothetical protein